MKYSVLVIQRYYFTEPTFALLLSQEEPKTNITAYFKL